MSLFGKRELKIPKPQIDNLLHKREEEINLLEEKVKLLDLSTGQRHFQVALIYMNSAKEFRAAEDYSEERNLLRIAQTHMLKAQEFYSDAEALTKNKKLVKEISEKLTEIIGSLSEIKPRLAKAEQRSRFPAPTKFFRRHKTYAPV